MTSRRAQRRARQRALDALEADPASCAYDARGQSVAAATEGDDPLTTRRAAKSQTSAGKAEEAPIHGPGHGGRDRRTAQEYARDLARETERSLARDPKRWTQRRTNELPRNRSIEPESPS